jgi:3-hydroxy-3-methylglutaryl CoA synthase
MSGIVDYGAYIPVYRLKRDLITQVWGSRAASVSGEKAVCNYDEDSVTMAVAAGIDCIGGFEHGKPDILYFATTTANYREKQSASTIATALNLPSSIRTADFTDSLRSGTVALNAALDAVGAGSARSAIVIASDCRLGFPHSEHELIFGDGSAAIVVGNSNVIANVEGTHSIFNEIMDVWRARDDDMVRSAEQRFILTKGYMDVVQELVSTVFHKYDLKPEDFAKVVLYAPDIKSHTTLVEKLGFDPQRQVQDPLLTTVGNTGSASALMMLVAALEEGKPGDRILLINYGDGADAFIFSVTEEITKIQGKRGIKSHLESKAMLSEYHKYANWRNLILEEGARRPPTQSPSVTCLWRERDRILALKGSKCKRCATVQYPPQRVCARCRAKDEFDDYKISDKVGRVVTYSIDHLTAAKDPPAVFAWVDFDGGGRIHCEITDHSLREPSIGMPVEMTFRKLYEAGGISNYFWKARPIR